MQVPVPMVLDNLLLLSLLLACHHLLGLDGVLEGSLAGVGRGVDGGRRGRQGGRASDHWMGGKRGGASLLLNGLVSIVVHGKHLQLVRVGNGECRAKITDFPFQSREFPDEDAL